MLLSPTLPQWSCCQLFHNFSGFVSLLPEHGASVPVSVTSLEALPCCKGAQPSVARGEYAPRKCFFLKKLFLNSLFCLFSRLSENVVSNYLLPHFPCLLEEGGGSEFSCRGYQPAMYKPTAFNTLLTLSAQNLPKDRLHTHSYSKLEEFSF